MSDSSTKPDAKIHADQALDNASANIVSLDPTLIVRTPQFGVEQSPGKMFGPTRITFVGPMMATTSPP
ncbi:hypothetical protein [Bradyrhizobium sp. CCGUVB23]|uniref:hypothetical protein n=1 Tax=Bradyrhizobium sp. CCGUVB23 TaxID=2949630 RepID=UPI0020B1C805|nr:hypothetical protein [Bradyrhizobium sp. CCGUVB23]MCP3459669.1 hypothetical protein [Bradyrhizobium sp. CCGUVB23]